MANPTVRVGFLGDASQLAREARRASESLDGVGRHAHLTATALGTALGTAAGRGIGAIAAAAGHAVGSVGQLAAGAIEAASAMNETVSKNAVVFGASAGAVRAWAEDSTKNIVLTRQAAIEASATFGNLFVALGVGQAPAAALSTQMVGLAEDLKSFNDVPVDQALDALRSGLLGEAEPLRKFGVSLSEARVQAEAYALGIVKPVKDAGAIRAANNAVAAAAANLAKVQKEHGSGTLAAAQAQDKLTRANAGLTKAMQGQKVPLTDAQKLQARTSIIMKDTATAQGDLSRTQDSYANSTAKLHKQVGDLAEKLGEKLLPYAERATHAVSDLITEFDNGTGAGGRLREDLSKLGETARDLGNDLKPVVDVARWFVEHPDAFKGAAEGMAAYWAASRLAAIWNARLAASTALPAVAAGIEGVALAAPGAAAGIEGIGIAAHLALPEIVVMAATLAAAYETWKTIQGLIDDKKHPITGPGGPGNKQWKIGPDGKAFLIDPFEGDSTAHPLDKNEHGAPPPAWNAKHNTDVAARAASAADSVKKAADTTGAAQKYAADQAAAAAKAKSAAADALAAATDKLQQALEDRRQMAKGVHDSLVDSTSILRNGAAWTTKDLLSRFQNEAHKLQRFQTAVAGLAAKGFDKTVIQQAAQGGIGNLGAVVGLSRATAAQVAQVNATQRAIDRAAGGVGNTAAASMGPIINVYIDGKEISAKVITSHSKDLAKAVNRENARADYNGARLT